MHRLKSSKWFKKVRRHRRVVILAVLCVAVALTLTVSMGYDLLKPAPGTTTSSSSITGASSGTATIPSLTDSFASQASYVTSSPPNSSQWLVLRSVTKPVLVIANNTGTIPAYASESLLNQTKIGTFCVSTDSLNDTCASFETFFQTGWFWDSSNSVLYIHYVGDPFVKIVVQVQ